ncbi:universal stress protein [Streptomyces kanamyceticus]|uniref:Universal stress protein n=1 Tax=Streptomyces kanamyceticus TaxID=1967 RepID=A0A5J6G7Z6_STRKN|nr:universal stress protein [Streptomyces kanamyceticus]QEU90125.1 universal stress protein [Streptomyces kanamyceticus]
MTPQQTITAGIDGSLESLEAADWAAREALRRDLPLHLVHAYDQPSDRSRLPEIEVPFHRESGALDRAVLRLAAAHPALGILDEQVTGPPVESLLATAGSAALLVLGSRGFGALTGALVGSVALSVAARAVCPVVLVRAGEHPDDGREDQAAGTHRPVVLGLDLDHPCDELLEFAFTTAAVRHAPLQVVHAYTVPLLPATDATNPEVAKSHLLGAALTPWRHKFPATQVTERLVRGLAGHHLVKETAGAGLLVIGRRIPAGEHLGPTAHSVIHHAKDPVAIVPHN